MCSLLFIIVTIGPQTVPVPSLTRGGGRH